MSQYDPMKGFGRRGHIREWGQADEELQVTQKSWDLNHLEVQLRFSPPPPLQPPGSLASVSWLVRRECRMERCRESLGRGGRLEAGVSVSEGDRRLGPGREGGRACTLGQGCVRGTSTPHLHLPPLTKRGPLLPCGIR